MDTTTVKKFALPTIFVIFGITGDLVKKKILRSLYHLYLKKLLPNKFRVYGFSRREFSDEDLHAYLKEVMTNHNFDQPELYDTFLSFFSYVEGDFHEEDSYHELAEKLGMNDGEWSVCSNKLYYLAVPPTTYSVILKNLHESGLTIPCSPEEGWTRVILEKPFGTNLQTAKELDMQLGELFKEEQIYRVDHYLGKETVRNILAFRFSNSFLGPAWNREYIEKIEVRLFEKDAVHTRGDFYDKVGALRDVGQNHMLQLLSLFIMNQPAALTPENIKQKRSEAMQSLCVCSSDEIAKQTIRGQYDGYLQEKGVAAESQTETYFKILTYSNLETFADVPLYLESGKAMAEDLIEVKVTFKQQMPLTSTQDEIMQNSLHYHLKPDEKISMRFLAKKPGFAFELKEQELGFNYRQAYQKSEFVDDYEALLFDIIKGDQTLFVSTDEIMREWEFIQPIVETWQQGKPELFTYKPGSEIKHQIELIEPIFMPKEIAVIGLGKMGSGIALQLRDKGWNVHAYTRSPEKRAAYKEQQLLVSESIEEMLQSYTTGPRVIWLMLTAGDAIEQTLFGEKGLINYLQKGDIVVEAGNSFYKDAAIRAEKLLQKGIQYVDVGVSGGPAGARYGACLMIGGSKKLFEYMKPLYKDLSRPDAYAHFDGYGAGHFVKMVHNGIEYGMMQAIGEGFEVLQKSQYNLDLKEITRIYNNGSVIESRLIGWLGTGFLEWGEKLAEISGSINATGEGEWTINAAKEMNIPVPVIEESFKFRQQSKENPSYTGQVVSALRGQFGGHAVKKDSE
ncbi:MAG: glucose-6-phosphate dehydrogenase [Weeksellaceae bacterium]